MHLDKNSYRPVLTSLYGDSIVELVELFLCYCLYPRLDVCSHCRQIRLIFAQGDPFTIDDFMDIIDLSPTERQRYVCPAGGGFWYRRYLESEIINTQW